MRRIRMKKSIYFLAYFLVLLPLAAVGLNSQAQSNPDQELNNESVNYQSRADTKEKAKLPQTIIIKKDVNGKLSVFKSSERLKKVGAKDVSQLEKLPFESLENTKGLKVENLSASINELDNDKPRQSWYFWYGGWGYNYYYPYAYYYYPLYYYSYAYYPYYYYAYNGCSYYYYNGGCGRGYC